MKFTQKHTLKEQKGIYIYRFFNPDAISGRVFNIMPRAAFPPEKKPDNPCIGGSLGLEAGGTGIIFVQV